MKVWLSEQGVCTLVDIENSCRIAANRFYLQIQQQVFDDKFPIHCDRELNQAESYLEIDEVDSRLVQLILLKRFK